MSSRFVLGAALCGCVLARGALAERAVLEVRDECTKFTMVADDAAEISGWNQILSLASCVQDTSPVAIQHVADVHEQLDGLSRRMVPALAIYLEAVQHAPVTVQLAATYQIGLAQLAMVTLARASIVTPVDFATNPRAAALHKRLQARIDEEVAPMLQIAWMAFTMLDTVADDNPRLVADPVMTANVAFARRMLQRMPDPRGPATVMAMR